MRKLTGWHLILAAAALRAPELIQTLYILLS